MRENDIKKDFGEAYKFSHTHWSEYWVEAKRDLEYFLGKQWDAEKEAYLKSIGRERLTFNKLRRVVKLVTGYQRKNRLALRVEPIEGSSQTASQLSKGVMWSMQNSNAYHVMSDCFEMGALVEGMNLAEPFIDMRNDFIDGDMRLKRHPYHKFLLDPNLTQRDLSDCGHILTRDYLSKDGCKSILPSSVHKDIDRLKHKGLDNKFTDYIPSIGLQGKDRLAYDQFWVRGTRQITIVADPHTGEMKEWTGDKQRLGAFIGTFPHLKVIKRSIGTVRLNVLIEGEVIYYAEDPYGIGDYPYIPIFGFFVPEYDKAKEKVQGLVRCMRDPQTEVNKRRSQLIDMMESQINSGWEAEEDSVLNEKDLYQSGQGAVIWKKKGTKPEALKKILPADIPTGYFQLSEIHDKDLDEIPGANAELFGTPDNDDIQVAGILAKLRSANGLTVLQDLFDNYRLSKKLLGNKVIRVVQNYSPQKVERIIDQKPTQEFYDKKFGKYDCLPEEGLLTDTQREQYAAQLIALKNQGLPISSRRILENVRLENKDEVLAEADQIEKQQQQNAQVMQQLQAVQMALANSQVQENLAGAQAKRAQGIEDLKEAQLDHIKGIKELWGVDLQQLREAIQLYQILSGQMQTNQHSQQQLPQQPQQAPQLPQQPPVPNTVQ